MAKNLLRQQKAADKKEQLLKEKEEKRIQSLSKEEIEKQEEEKKEHQKKEREQAEKEKERQNNINHRSALREKARERVAEKSARYSEDDEYDELTQPEEEKAVDRQESNEAESGDSHPDKGGFLSKQKQKRAFIVFIAVLTVGLMAIIITNALKRSDNDSSNNGTGDGELNTTEDVYTVYEEDGRYSIDSEGNLTYTNGDDIAQSLESTYTASIKSSMTLAGNEYSQEFVSENGENGVYNHGVKNGEAFDEVSLYTNNGGSYCLARTGDTFTEVEEMVSSYSDVPSLIMAVLFSDNVEKVSDTEFKASVLSDYFDFCLPYGTNGYVFNMNVTVKRDGDNIIVSASGSNLEGKSLYYMYGDDEEEAEEAKMIDAVSFTATYSKFTGYSYDFTSILEELNSRVSEEEIEE